MSEEEIIEKIRECKTKEQLFAFMEMISNSDMKFWLGKDWQDFSKVKPEKGQYLVFSNGCMSVDFWTGGSWVGHLEKVDYWMNTPSAPIVGGV